MKSIHELREEIKTTRAEIKAISRRPDLRNFVKVACIENLKTSIRLKQEMIKELEQESFINVVVTFENNDTLCTKIKGTFEEAEHYYLNNKFNLYDDGQLYKAVRVAVA